jgi:hypothetical protein
MNKSLLALMLLAVGCGGSGSTACPALAAANFGVTVVDASSGQRICDATVSATETSSGSSMALTPFGGSSDCTYSGGFYERAGTFSLSVQKSGYVTATQSGVVVTKGVCNVSTVPLTIRLSK